MEIPDSIHKQNETLGRVLGRNPQGEPVFMWCWSEDLYWPAYATGRNTTKQVPVPILFTDAMEYVPMVVPEYKRDLQSTKLHDQWVIAKWCKAEDLDQWRSVFPGADYPAQGYRVFTNAALPPMQEPTVDDTERLIRCINEQSSMTFDERLADMTAEQDRIAKSKRENLVDQIKDSFTAGLNPNPGTRGNFVSFPSTTKQLAGNEFLQP